MIFYEFILFFLTLIAGIRKPHHLRRFFAKVPDPQGKEVIWIHAVSVGETKAVQTFFEMLRKDHPNTFFIITTITESGLAEARRSLAEADAFAHLPVDIRPVVRHWVKKLRPKLFFLVESDFWPNLLFAIKKQGGKTILVSGKISDRSTRRFSWFLPFSKKLFGAVDLMCVQNEEHAARFRLLADPCRIQIGGNLKLDCQPKRVDAGFWRAKLPMQDHAITVSCTHSPEEEKLLDLLSTLPYFIFLAPRHPERFDEVAKILERKKIAYFRWSQIEKRKGKEKVLLMDAMGQLPVCYALSRLTIVAGSFEPHVGGHNILEPCLYDVPVLFGPYMDTQKELVEKVILAKAGIQTDYSTLSDTIQTFFTTPSLEAGMRMAAKGLKESVGGATRTTYQYIRLFNNV